MITYHNCKNSKKYELFSQVKIKTRGQSLLMYFETPTHNFRIYNCPFCGKTPQRIIKIKK